jgi:predicted dehydrogenase
VDTGGAGHGTSDMFAYQARAFLDQIAGSNGLPTCPDFRDGLRGVAVLDAVAKSARSGGAAVKIT